MTAESKLTRAELAGAPPIPQAVWYYSAHNTSHGPVSDADLKALYDNGAIYDDTLVWSETNGGDWAPYSGTINPSTNGYAPPLPANQINDLWVWLIAVTPIVGHIAEIIITKGEMFPNDIQILVWLAYAVVYGLLASADVVAVKRSGRTTNIAPSFLGVMFVPLYLIIRSSRLGKTQLPIIVFIASFIGAMFIPPQQVLSLANVSFSLPTCESETSVRQIKSMFPNLPINFGKLPALDVDDIETINSFDEQNQCTATVHSLANQEFRVKYSIEKSEGQYMYYLQLIF